MILFFFRYFPDAVSISLLLNRANFFNVKNWCVIFLLMSVGHFILQVIRILTLVTVWSTFTLLPVAFCSDDFCNRNMRVRSENSENQLFLNVIPHNPGNWLSVLPVVTTSVLEAAYSQV